MVGTRILLLDDDRRVDVAGEVRSGRVLAAAADLAATTGWTLKPEGLCRDDVCVPVRDRDALVAGDLIDVEELGRLLGREVVVDPDAGAVAFGEPAHAVAEQMRGLRAPAFTLPDVEGRPVSLADFDRRKRLLLAWSSW